MHDALLVAARKQSSAACAVPNIQAGCGAVLHQINYAHQPHFERLGSIPRQEFGAVLEGRLNGLYFFQRGDSFIQVLPGLSFHRIGERCVPAQHFLERISIPACGIPMVPGALKCGHSPIPVLMLHGGSPLAVSRRLDHVFLPLKDRVAGDQ